VAQISPREKRLLAWTVIIALAVLIQMTVLRPLLNDGRRLRNQVKTTAQNLQHLQAMAARKESVELAYEEIRTFITSTLSPADETINMVKTIDRIAKDNDVEIMKNVPIDKESMEYFDRQAVRFEGKGKVEQLMAMIWTLQDQELLFKIPQIKLTMKEQNMLMIEMDIARVVYLPEKLEETNSVSETGSQIENLIPQTN
jgi:hypothetical protein